MLLSALMAISLAWTPLPDNISVSVHVDPAVAPFHEQVIFSIDVEVPPGTSYDIVPMFLKFDGLQGVPSGSPTETLLEDGRVRVQQSYLLDAIFEGQYAPEPVSIEIDGATYTIPSPVICIRELTDEERALAEQFNPAVPMYEPESPGSMLNRRTFWALAALALAIAIAVVYALRRRTAAGPVRPLDPWELALNRLRALEERGLPAKGDIDRYYVDLSAILRYYIEGRFAIHAPERTTPEFLDEMLRAKLFDDRQESFLGEFLKHCDRVKFARLVPATDLMTEHLAAVRAFVEETIPQEEPEESAEAA